MGILKKLKEQVRRFVGGNVEEINTLYSYDHLPSVNVQDVFNDINIVYKNNPRAIYDAVHLVLDSKEGKDATTWEEVLAMCPQAIDYIPASFFEGQDPNYGIPTLLVGFLSGEDAINIKFVPQEFRTPKLYRFAIENYLNAYEDAESFDEDFYREYSETSNGNKDMFSQKDKYGNVPTNITCDAREFLKEIPLRNLTSEDRNNFVKIDSRSVIMFPAVCISKEMSDMADDKEGQGYFSPVIVEGVNESSWKKYIINQKIMPAIDKDPQIVCALDQYWMANPSVRKGGIYLLDKRVSAGDRLLSSQFDFRKSGIDQFIFKDLVDYYSIISLKNINKNDYQNAINKLYSSLDRNMSNISYGNRVQMAFEGLYRGFLTDLIGAHRDVADTSYIQKIKRDELEDFILEIKNFKSQEESRERIQINRINNPNGLPTDTFFDIRRTFQKKNPTSEAENLQEQDSTNPQGEDLLRHIRETRTWKPMWEQNDDLKKGPKQDDDNGQ